MHSAAADKIFSVLMKTNDLVYLCIWSRDLLEERTDYHAVEGNGKLKDAGKLVPGELDI
jgi:hypothetical protein